MWKKGNIAAELLWMEPVEARHARNASLKQERHLRVRGQISCWRENEHPRGQSVMLGDKPRPVQGCKLAVTISEESQQIIYEMKGEVKKKYDFRLNYSYCAFWCQCCNIAKKWLHLSLPKDIPLT